MTLKSLISSPLEAGPSVLDAHRLPAGLDAALEYAARRLARRNLSIDLVVIRRHYQLPRASLEPAEPDALPPDRLDRRDHIDGDVLACLPQSSLPTPSSLPALASRELPPSSPPVTRSRLSSALRGLVRARALPGLMALRGPPAASASSASSMSSPVVSPTFSASSASGPTASTAGSSDACWPLTPSKSALPSPCFLVRSDSAVSTFSTASTVSTSALSAFKANPALVSGINSSVDIWLVYADSLAVRSQRLLRQALEKAAHKFHISLGVCASAGALGLPSDLMQASMEQNEVLFSASTSTGGLGSYSSQTGLTLRSADHLYTFKAALCSYAESGDPLRLEDAVDELRRYVLAMGGQRLAKRELLRRYPGLDFAEADLADVGLMYSRAYGGPERESGIELDGLSSCPVETEWPIFAWPLGSRRDSRTGVAVTRWDEGDAPEDEEVGDAGEVEQEKEEHVEGQQADAMATQEGRGEEEVGMEDAYGHLLDEYLRPHTRDDEEQMTPTATTAESSLSPSTMLSIMSLSSLSSSVVLGLAAQQRRQWRREQAKREAEEKEGDEPAATVPDETHTALRTAMGADASEAAGHETEKREKTETRPAEPPTQEPPETVAAVVVATPRTRAPGSPKSPLLPSLRLQTTFDTHSGAGHAATASRALVGKTAARPASLAEPPTALDDDEELLTARPTSCVRKAPAANGPTGGGWRTAASIGELLQDEWNSRCGGVSPGGLSAGGLSAGGRSPGGWAGDLAPPPTVQHDDFSPVTRSEWGFLMGGQQGRQVVVTTC